MYLWVLAPKPWNLALNKGSWDLKPKVANIKGTNLKSLITLEVEVTSHKARYPTRRVGYMWVFGVHNIVNPPSLDSGKIRI